MNHIRHESGSHPHGFQLFRALPLLIAVLLCLPIGLKAAVSADIASASQQVTKTVTVSIKDVVGPLAGANVSVKGTKNGANTDSNGKVTLANVPANSTLVISYMGYKTQEISVSVGTSFEVVLEEDTNMLDELVVIGYGTVKKSDMTGSVSSVKIDQVQASQSATFDKLLQGRAAGVQVTSASGAPGGAVNIKIRGTSSFNGSSEPLYVVDGIILNPASQDVSNPIGSTGQEAQNALTSINPNDIASMEILKDASATAIYGSMGANGVVLITTKSGVSERPKLTFSSTLDFSKAYKKHRLPRQWATPSRIPTTWCPWTGRIIRSVRR